MLGPRAADCLKKKLRVIGLAKSNGFMIVDWPNCWPGTGCGFHAQFVSLLPTNAYSLPPLSHTGNDLDDPD